MVNINTHNIDQLVDTPFIVEKNKSVLDLVEIISKFDIDEIKATEEKEYYKKFVSDNGQQKFDTSFLDTNTCFNACLSKISKSLPTKSESYHIYNVENWNAGSRVIDKTYIDNIVNEVLSHECDKDMINRVFNTEYPMKADDNNGYILAGDKGRGKTTLLLTHYAGDLIRSFVKREKIIYFDWLNLNDYKFWHYKENNNYIQIDVDSLIFNVKTVYINDFLNTPLGTGWQSDIIAKCIAQLIFKCYSRGIKLNITTNKTKEMINEILTESDQLGTMIDRLPKKIIEFKGESYRK